MCSEAVLLCQSRVVFVKEFFVVLGLRTYVLTLARTHERKIFCRIDDVRQPYAIAFLMIKG